MSVRIALLGLGTMGTGMARRLLSHQWPLTVYNRRSEVAQPFAAEGAEVRATPAEAAKDAAIIMGMVADDAASRSIWLGTSGALAGANPGTICIESSTLSPAWTEELAQACKQKHCLFLDAPVTGTKPHAAAGELVFLVGGDKDVLARVQTVFDTLGRRTVYIGPTGSGARMKLINNFLCGVQAAALAEALALADRCGLAPEAVTDVLANGAPGSPLVKTLIQRIAERTYQPNFLLRLMEKDLAYASTLAAQSNLTLRTAEAARELFAEAAASGWAEKDFSAVIEPLRERAVHA